MLNSCIFFWEKSLQKLNAFLFLQKLVDEGIFAILDACTESELSLMSTAFENAEREHFRQLRAYYEKHHKFHGKT